MAQALLSVPKVPQAQQHRQGAAQNQRCIVLRRKALDAGPKNCKRYPLGPGLFFARRHRTVLGPLGGFMSIRLKLKLTCLLGLLTVVLVMLPGSAMAQDLVKEALSGFPTQTIRLEFSNPAKLRALPNYASLRQRYIGPRLRKLVDALAQLGIREEDISNLVTGWQPGTTEMGLYGFATGNFSAQAITQSAAERNITPTPVAGKQAYCLEAGLAGSCIVVLQDSLGAFGSLTALTSMLETHEGQIPSIGSDSHMASLVDSADKEAPI